MPVPMARPWKHPKTGMYWLRKRVPDDLRPLLGKVEEKRSLKTKSAAEAKVLIVKALAELEQRWSNLRQGPKVLSEVEAHGLAASVYDQVVDLHRSNPSEQRVWDPKVAVEDVWRQRPTLEIDLGVELLKLRCFEVADHLLTEAGLVVDSISQERLARAVSAAMRRASVTLEKLALGEGLDARIVVNPGAQTGAPGKPISLDELVEDWSRERSPSKKTLYEWTRVIKELKAYLGHDDAARISSQDLNGWKTKLLSEGRRPKTIRDAKIAPVRAILQWGADNDRLPTNVAARVTIDVKVNANERKRSFTDTEATTVLSAARKEVNPVLRWVPWLGAYTGARVAELCQLRREDVFEIEQVWCLRITAEAGPLKTLSSERIVPVHSTLIGEGFLRFVEKTSSGPLFKALTPDKFGSRGGNGTKMLGRWVRALGITDSRISPNHSWRHRMKTLARLHEVRPDIGDALVGHGKKSVGDGYGEFQVAALKREIEKIPRLKI